MQFEPSHSTVVFAKEFIMIRFGSLERDYSLSKEDMTLEKGLRAIVPKFRLEVCKMKKSKIPKLCQNIGLDELFLFQLLLLITLQIEPPLSGNLLNGHPF